MSRIGKQPVAVPANVEVTIDGHNLTVKGPKGELHRSFNPMMTIAREGDEIIVSRPDDSREAKSLHGLTRTLIHNMVEGVENGFQKKLQLVGVGYRAAPEGISFEVPSQTEIIVHGASKEQVGQIAADIRKWRKPEPYKGKGIRYEGEVVRRKLGKAAKSD